MSKKVIPLCRKQLTNLRSPSSKRPVKMASPHVSLRANHQIPSLRRTGSGTHGSNSDHTRLNRKRRLQRLSRHGLRRARKTVAAHDTLGVDGISVWFECSLIPVDGSTVTSVSTQDDAIYCPSTLRI